MAMDGVDLGRSQLAAWRAAKSTNFYEAAPHLAALLELGAGTARARAVAPGLRAFGGAVATVVEPSVATLEGCRELPSHVPFDSIGRRVDRIDFHPAYETVGRAVWGSGILAVNRGGRGAYEQMALFYLLSHAGEGGHACPVVCTAGLARALERRASEQLTDAYLGGLLSSDYDTCLRGSQFLTEVQGGSDVGANGSVAIPDATEPGAWRLHGEKWFCSVADADLFAVTARPEGASLGTRGLGCFLVPRSLEGRGPNGFRIRRLKDKLGTRCLASAEIEFDGALGWPIGEVGEGFHVAVEELLNTSRWLNAVGSSGLMRRAYLEAASFARHRRAFGTRIGEFQIVRAQLASMKVDEHAALASTFLLTGLVERIDAALASSEERAAHRVLVNANKFVTSIDASDVVHRGIEVLGGNGTIEDFSPLPRLYRDAVVYESWEGTHNVLCAQVHRDLGHGDTLESFLSWLTEQLRSSTGDATEAARRELATLAPVLRSSTTSPGESTAAFRAQLGSLVRIVQASALAALATHEQSDQAVAVAELFANSRLSVDATGSLTVDPGLVDRVLDSDLDP
jgi:alkylation response protein AidB-like acyl-CoA dehydrogenase